MAEQLQSHQHILAGQLPQHQMVFDSVGGGGGASRRLASSQQREGTAL